MIFLILLWHLNILNTYLRNSNYNVHFSLNYSISNAHLESLPTITFRKFEGVNIPYNDTVKNVGVQFDRTLLWKPQMAEVRRRVFAA